MRLPWSPADDGILLTLRVTPRARRNAIEGMIADADDQARLKVSVTAVASEGAANKAVIALLAKTWRMPKSAIAIVAGAADRRKTVHIAGDTTDLTARLDRWWQKVNGLDKGCA
ncbi:MAG: DUF167 family protein [Dongiaceae bacterium]